MADVRQAGRRDSEGAGDKGALGAGGYAGDAVAAGGSAWAAWAACLDPEPHLLAAVRRDWPLREGGTPEAWRERVAAVPFTVTLARVRAGRPVEARELWRGLAVPGGPALAAPPTGGRPVVVWTAREGGVCRLFAAVDGATSEVVAEGGSAMLGPRAAADGEGGLWVAWQQWPPPDAGGPGAPQVRLARRTAAPPGAPGAWGAPVVLSDPGAPAWAPALAAGPDGGLWCAWDAWDGQGYGIVLRRAGPGPGGQWGPALRLTAPDRRHFHLAPDIAPGAAQAWVVWGRSQRWGDLNHRFNHLRTVQAALVRSTPDRPPWPSGGPALALAHLSQLPVGPVPFLHSLEEEFVNPLAPRVRLDGDGRPVVFFRRFRSTGFKDFGWTIWACRHTGQGWTPPQRLSATAGLPDTPFGVCPDGDGAWLLCHPACDYPREAGDHPSRPLSDQRVEVETVSLAPAPPAGAAPSHGDGEGEAGSGRAGAPVPVTPRARPRVALGGQEYEVLFGDLHRHSAYSKCMSANDGDPLDHWRWMRDVAGLDFYALTEHLEYMSYSEWRRIDELGHALATAGVLALGGFELAIPPGHVNFFYADEAVAGDLRLACLAAAGADLRAAWARLDAWVPPGAVAAIRHHQGHRGDDLAATYAPRYERLAEIVQTRGEYPEWVQSLWRQGLRVGVAGASDHSRGAPFTAGLTGLWLTPAERTPEGVLRGLQTRRTFATNGVRLTVFLSATAAGDSAGEAPVAMGDEGRVAGPPRLTLEAWGTRPLRSVAFHRGATLLHVATPEAETGGAGAAGAGPGARISYVDEEAPPGEHLYWARVVQAPEFNGRRPSQGVAYTSPVWLTVER